MADETLLEEQKALALSDAQGRVVLQVALTATLYFEHGHDLVKRRAVASCFADYKAMVGELLRWGHPGPSGFVRVAGTSPRAPSEWLVEPEFDENAGWEFTWHGGETKEDASSIMIRGLGVPQWESKAREALSFISFALPITWFAEHEGGFPSLLLRFCERIEPVHGYGGFGLVQSPNRFRMPPHERTVYALATRHPGLDIDEPLVHSLWLRDGIKGVNWLTILGDRWLSVLGGLDALRSAVGVPASVHAYPGGALVVAGAHPQLGDAHRGLYPTSYGPISRALRAIRVPSHPGLHTRGPIDREEFAAWLARLDSM